MALGDYYGYERTHRGEGMTEFLALIDWYFWLLFFIAAATGGAIVGAFYTHLTHRKREP